jgi:hypothetical protein
MTLVALGQVIRNVRTFAHGFHHQGAAGSDRRDRPEFQSVAAGQIPDVPSAEQRRSQIHPTDRQHQFGKNFLPPAGPYIGSGSKCKWPLYVK